METTWLAMRMAAVLVLLAFEGIHTTPAPTPARELPAPSRSAPGPVARCDDGVALRLAMSALATAP